MKLWCRVVKATRNDDDSQGWLSSAGFMAVARGQLKLNPKFSNAAILTEYLTTWGAMTAKLSSDCPAFFDHAVLEDGMNHLSVLCYETYEDWKAAMDAMDGSPEKENFFRARAALARLWNVTITIHEPIEIELTPSSAIRVQDLLSLLASKPDLASPAM